MLAATARNRRRQRFSGQLWKAFPLNVTAGTRYPEKQLSGLGI